jgi:hypothetical protein
MDKDLEGTDEEASSVTVLRSSRHRSVCCMGQHDFCVRSHLLAFTCHVDLCCLMMLFLPISRLHYHSSHSLLSSLHQPDFTPDHEHLEGKHFQFSVQSLEYNDVQQMIID